MLFLPNDPIEYTDDEVVDIVDFMTTILIPLELETGSDTMADIVANEFLSDYDDSVEDGVETP
ncbi:MAG: hypothetical protein HC877_23125 [Thioploca sp.]|nr:hypothetical protein [Thioploca sp.]